MGDLAVGIDISLLINPTNALECADVKGILRAQISGLCKVESGKRPTREDIDAIRLEVDERVSVSISGGSSEHEQEDLFSGAEKDGFEFLRGAVYDALDPEVNWDLFKNHNG